MTDSIFTPNDCELVKRELLGQGRFLTLARYHLRHRLFSGEWSEIYPCEMLERYSAAAVLPYDPKLDRVILIEQFRAGSIHNKETAWLIEIPAGVITDNISPEDTARHETIEEAGCTLLSLAPICEYYVSPGGSNEYLHLYCGIVDASSAGGIHGLASEHENIRVLNLSSDEAFAKLRAGEIKTSPAIISLLWLQSNRDRLKEIGG